jgi:hypothetical protein
MCIYKEQKYSEGSIIRFEDGNLHECFQGVWRLWQRFSLSIKSTGNDKLSASIIDDLVVNPNENNFVTIKSKKLHLDLKVGQFEDISHINISIKDAKSHIVVHYNKIENYENYCCVSCGGTTACGNSACITCGTTTICC